LSLAPPAPPAKLGAYPWIVAAALAVVYTFNFLDRQFLSVLAEPVKHDLHLSDTQLGMLTGLVFALFYTGFGIPIAALADRTSRVRIITIAYALWSLFTAACGLASGFGALAAARMCMGVGEAGGSPPSYSLISDYFPPRRRGVGLAIYSLGVPFGTLFGAMSGGFIAANFGWRAAFIGLGVAGMVLAPLLPLVVKEPPRGRYDTAEARAARPDPFQALGAFIRRPELLFTAVSAGLTAFVGYALLNWSPAFLMREKHMSLSEIALWYALVSGLSAAAGSWLSGVLVDRLGKARPAAYALVPGFAVLLSLPFVLAFVFAPTWPLALACLALPSILNMAYLAPCLAVVQNATPPAQRGVAGALLLFVLNLIGLGGGPLYVGMMSDHFHARYGVHALKAALVSVSPFFVLAFLCQLGAAYWLERRARSGVTTTA
jgi:MFS family permease